MFQIFSLWAEFWYVSVERIKRRNFFSHKFQLNWTYYLIPPNRLIFIAPINCAQNVGKICLLSLHLATACQKKKNWSFTLSSMPMITSRSVAHFFRHADFSWKMFFCSHLSTANASRKKTKNLTKWMRNKTHHQGWDEQQCEKHKKKSESFCHAVNYFYSSHHTFKIAVWTTITNLYKHTDTQYTQVSQRVIILKSVSTPSGWWAAHIMHCSRKVEREVGFFCCLLLNIAAAASFEVDRDRGGKLEEP